MRDMKHLMKKRMQVLETIKPICKAFNIEDYNYIVRGTGQTEILRIGEVKIGCSNNSISAVVDELIGYIFITKWCRNRSLGTFSTQAKNVIKRYWMEAE